MSRLTIKTELGYIPIATIDEIERKLLNDYGFKNYDHSNQQLIDIVGKLEDEEEKNEMLRL